MTARSTLVCLMVAVLATACNAIPITVPGPGAQSDGGVHIGGDLGQLEDATKQGPDAGRADAIVAGFDLATTDAGPPGADGVLGPDGWATDGPTTDGLLLDGQIMDGPTDGPNADDGPPGLEASAD